MICWGYSAFQCAWLWCNFKFLVFQVPWCPYLCEVHRSISCDIQVMFNMHRLNWVNKFRTGVYNYINSFILQSYQTPIVKHRLRGNQTVSILDVLLGPTFIQDYYIYIISTSPSFSSFHVSHSSSNLWPLYFEIMCVHILYWVFGTAHVYLLCICS